MFKRTLIFVLILSIISAHFSKLFVFAGFELNKTYIAAKLCINKNKPELQCFGKCFLKKKLKQAEEKQAQQEKQIQKNLFQEVGHFNRYKFNFYTALLQEISTPVKNNYLSIHSFSIFHPPA